MAMQLDNLPGRQSRQREKLSFLAKNLIFLRQASNLFDLRISVGMSGLMRDPKISLIIDEKWRSAVLPVDDLEINLDFIPNEGTFLLISKT